MENDHGVALTVAHGGNGSVWMKMDGPVDPFALLSRIIDSPVHSSAS
jgi:hypothetical protein